MTDLNIITGFLISVRDFLWSGPLLFLLFGVGIYQTISLKGIQFRYLWVSLKLLVGKHPNYRSANKSSIQNQKTKGDITAFQSIMTALAGSIGTGNIAGVATAIAVGGFGSLFWVWVMALFGMATAYSETVLAILFRQKNSKGYMSGGPMYVLKNGLNQKVMGGIYAFCAGIAILGIGAMVQANAITDAVTSIYNEDRIIIGGFLSFFAGSVIIGGVKYIGRVASVLVPFMAIIYVASGIGILAYYCEQLPSAIYLIINSAFNGQAAVGGFIGSSMAMALQNGTQYGIFANEAGLGSLAIASASAKVDKPQEQGLRSIASVFLGTMVICTITGLVLAVTNVLGAVDSSGELIKSTPLAILAFSKLNPYFSYVVIIGLILFSFTTILAWCYYGEKCFEYFLGVKVIYLYRWLFISSIAVGAVMKLDLVWAVANLASAVMALPNLLAVICLSKLVKKKTDSYLSDLDSKGLCEVISDAVVGLKG